MNYLDTIKLVHVRKFAVIECGGVAFRVWDTGAIDQWDGAANDWSGYSIDVLSAEEEAGLREIGLKAIKEQQ